MRLIRNVKGISKLFLILFLLIAFIIGALLSYVWTMGYYAPQEFHLPEKAYITIENVQFFAQDTSFFNVTVLNPSYSPSSVNISRIEARTTDDNRIHDVTEASPPIPYILNPGQPQTFRSIWNWANYTGIRLPYTDAPVEIRVFLDDGRAAIFETKRPRVVLLILRPEFNSTISVNEFNMTVENAAVSDTYVNITSLSVDVANITASMVTPTLPVGLSPGDPQVEFQVAWNWTDYQGQSVTLGAHTLQGYVHYLTTTLPLPVNLTITEVAFNISDTNHFNVAITNAEASPTYVDIIEVEVALSDRQPFLLSEWIASPSSKLERNSTVLIVCTWDWSTYHGQAVTVRVYTGQGFFASKTATIP